MTHTVPDDRLRIRVNGEPLEVPPGCTVAALLERLGITGGRVAVARNREVVPRAVFDTQELAPGDRIEILEAVGGG